MVLVLAHFPCRFCVANYHTMFIVFLCKLKTLPWTPGRVLLRIIQKEFRSDSVQGEEILACQKRF